MLSIVLFVVNKQGQVFQSGLVYPRLSAKFDFRSQSFNRKFKRKKNLIIGCSTKNRENYPKKAFEQRIKETHIKNLTLG